MAGLTTAVVALALGAPSVSAGATETSTSLVPVTGTTLSSLNWTTAEAPKSYSVMSTSSSTIEGQPAPTGTKLRYELRSGDVWVSGDGYVGHRAEVYGRVASSWSAPPSAWPDPPGSERWYDFRVFIPKTFPVATDTRWFTFTQWKGLRGGSPAVALEVKRSGLRLGGKRTNQGLVPNDGYLGPIAFGQWTRLTVGIRFGTSSSTGWVQVYRDGKLALPLTRVATMDLINGLPDPVYTKQGIYRDSVWSQTHVMYFAPLKVTSTKPL